MVNGGGVRVKSRHYATLERMKWFVCVASLAFLLFSWADAATMISGRRILVNDPGTSNFSPYFVRGVCYYPIPIGYCTQIVFNEVFRVGLLYFHYGTKWRFVARAPL